jgi:Arc/MetJ-type ribon-helix-helix transcriptional regulator
MIRSSYSQPQIMKQKIAVTIDRELVSFIDQQAQGNRSDYLNSLITQERRKILASEIIAALQADIQDPEYQAEIAEWDRLAGDGIDA